MGDNKRFHLFANLINQEVIDKTISIVDVAGGKGYLQAALRQKGFLNITSWDKRKKTASNRKGYKYCYFDWRCKEKYQLVVAMHPDEGTDHCILYAGKHRIPAFICPCCIRPSATAYWKSSSHFSDWLVHLKELAQKNLLSVEERILPMNGRNLVLILYPQEFNTDE